MNGIINVYKEKGYTSHDVVAKLRGILHMKKIGHTGTLDPDAVGVLPVCVGKGTKVCSLLTDKDKTYEAVVQLGVITDTEDMTGEVLETRPVTVTDEDIKKVLPNFIGEIEQIPPMYSAIKVQGKKLYELAREGKTIERKPRKITIHQLELINTNLAQQEFSIRVTCSKGTYIRTLCQDIGEKLGCGAAMKALVRTRVGNFSIENAKTLGEIEQQGPILLPIEEVFSEYASCHVTEAGMKYLKNGNMVTVSLCDYKGVDGESVRMYGTDGDFYAIYQYEAKGNKYHIKKMFHE